MIPLELGGSDGTTFSPFMIEFYFLLIRRLGFVTSAMVWNDGTWFL